MTILENKQLVQSFLDASMSGNWDKLRAVIADDLVYNYPHAVEMFLDMERVIRGGGEYMKIRTNVGPKLYGSPKKTLIMNHLIAENDIVVAHYTVDGSTAAGGTYGNNYCFLFRIKDGKVAEIWEHTDSARALSQFGFSITKPQKS